MIIKWVEVVDQFLIIVHRDIWFRLFDIFNLLLVACDLLFDLFDHSLVILYLLLHVFVSDSLSRVNSLLPFLALEVCLLELNLEARLNQCEHICHLWITLSDICQSIYVDLSLFSRIDISQICKTFKFVLNLDHLLLGLLLCHLCVRCLDQSFLIELDIHGICVVLRWASSHYSHIIINGLVLASDWYLITCNLVHLGLIHRLRLFSIGILMMEVIFTGNYWSVELAETVFIIVGVTHFVNLLGVFATCLRFHYCVGLEMLAAAFRIVRNTTLVVRRLICNDVFISIILSRSALLVTNIDTMLLLQLVHMCCLGCNIGIIDALFASFLL